MARYTALFTAYRTRSDKIVREILPFSGAFQKGPLTFETPSPRLYQLLMSKRLHMHNVVFIILANLSMLGILLILLWQEIAQLRGVTLRGIPTVGVQLTLLEKSSMIPRMPLIDKV